ncbi:polyprotein [Gerbil hepacivirus]|nr:polyprotein [Gerbil hepacivirus]
MMECAIGYTLTMMGCGWVSHTWILPDRVLPQDWGVRLQTFMACNRTHSSLSLSICNKVFALPLAMSLLLPTIWAVGTGKPRGKVVGGVYIVNPKKTTDKGARRKRRQRRDLGGMRRSAIGPIDPWLRTAVHVALPSPAYPSRDPRRQSRFLGHVIDGTLGWVADMAHHVPLVGPLVGHPARVVCRVVRSVENACNAVTGTVGIHLFLIILVACLLPTTGAVSNCCTSDQVAYCTDVTCVHETGCAICEQQGDQTICWEPAGLMLSHHPNYTGVDTFLTHHIDFVAGTIFVCDLAGVKELCGAATLFATAVLNWLPSPLVLNETADCYLLVKSGLNPLTTSFFTWLAEEFSTITALVDFIGKVPVAVAHAFTQSHFITMCSIAGLALNGNLVKAFALVVLYIEAAAAASIPQQALAWNSSCNMLGLVPPCGNWTEHASGKDGWCFNPRTGFQRMAGKYPVDGWFCVWIQSNTGAPLEPGCCSVRTRPSFCNNCSSDCTWADPRQTFEVCGATPVLSTACSRLAIAALSSVLPTLPPGTTGVVRRDCMPAAVALLSIPGVYWGPEWRASSIVLTSGFSVAYWYNTVRLNNLTYRSWARLPGTPPSTQGSWMFVPRGMYSSKRDISSGLIMKDVDYEDYQLLFSGVGTYIISGITLHVVVIALLAALGARWCLLFYALINVIPRAYAFTPEMLASTAASPWEDMVVRGAVYCYVLFRPPLSVPLSGSPVGFLFVTMWHVVSAFSLTDVAFAGGSVAFFVAWSGLLSRYVPMLVLTQSYLRTRLEISAHRWLDRSLLFLAVLVFPKAVWNTCLTLWICWALLVAVGHLAVKLLGPKDRLSLWKTLQTLSKCAWWVARILRPVVIWAAGENGVFWYEHIHGKLEGVWSYTEPYYPFATEVLLAEDVGRKLACGDTIKGLPVYARAGSTVRAGIAQLPRGWKKTIPFSVKVTAHRNQLKVLGLCLTGNDSAAYTGSICIIGTPLRSWMGFCANGALYTVHHGSHGRHMSTAAGVEPPRLVNKTLDLCKYPMPKGMIELKTGHCSCTEFFLVTRLGNIIPLVKVEQRFVNTSPLTLKEAKGSSGAPILCKCQYVKAMFLSCRSARGVVSSLGAMVLDQTAETDTRVPTCSEIIPPAVPKREKRIERLVAPTGSGKTTKLPMHYYSNGHSVLVLNPSVATTRSVPKYMHSEYKITPNVRTGDYCMNNGCRLTYSTYGMFLTQPVLDADVVICDEVHSVDATTILGIGAALKSFENSAKCKLLILATATPPGTPMQEHPNITTVTLTDDGDFPFHGKKIDTAKLKTGRHLIFTPGKKHCDQMAADLCGLGINAISYYRGKDAKCIPEEGPVVVIATDALMTGYTGNFDSVYDSCLAVTPTYEVTMSPTFEVGIRNVNADAVTRMQRRGRTGRGKPGTYYQVTPHCAVLGTAPQAAIVEAFDSGLAYYGLTTAEVATMLSFYKDEQITPGVDISIPEIQAVFQSLPYVEHVYIEKMKNAVDNYTYLYAAQYQLAKQQNAMAPNCNEHWKGLNGSAKFPVLYELEEYNHEKVVHAGLASHIASCFEEYFSSTLLTLAGVGLASACVITAVDMLGSIVVKRCFSLTSDTTAATLQLPPEDITEQLEECTRWEGFAEATNRVSSWLADKMVELGVNLGGRHPLVATAEHYLPHLLAGIQYFAGMACLQEAPGMGAVLGFVGGVLSPLPLNANLFLTALGGAMATRLTTQRGAAAFALAGALGAVTGATGFGSIVASIFSCYGAATSTCLVVLKLIDGRLPDLSELASLAFNLASPGACLIGAAAALMVGYCTRTESQVWMNRLLAMLHRGTSCEEYFVANTTLRSNIIKLLERVNLWAVFKTFASWLNSHDEDLCTPRGCFRAVIESVGQFLRLAVEAAYGMARRVFKLPTVPWVTCDTGYKGPWIGSGIVKVQCNCNQEQIWNVVDGKAQWVGGSKACCSWWTGGVVINSTFIGCPRPRPAGWTTMAVCTGFSNFVTYRREGTDVYVTGVSNPDQVVESVVPDLLSAVAVDGVQVKPYGGTGWRNVGPYTCRLRRAGETVSLQIPFKLEPCKEPFKEVPCPSPAVIAAVGQTERCMGVVTAKPVRRGSLERPKHSCLSDDGAELSPADLMRSLHASHQKLQALQTPAVTFGCDTDSSMEGPVCTPEVPTSTSFEDTKRDLLESAKALSKKADSWANQRGGYLVANPRKRVTIKKGTDPLPSTSAKGSPPPPTTYSLHSSSWTDCSSDEISETECSRSYVWYLPELVYKGLRRTAAAVSTYTYGIMRHKPLVYATTPSSINARIAKVTIDRSRVNLPELEVVIQEAKRRVGFLECRELSLEEALAITPNKTAKSAITGLTAAKLKSGATAHVAELYSHLEKGEIPSPWNQVNIMPKSEVFVKTPQKPSQKPSRIIAYPHLEMRVVEKMVLGEIGPATVKAVCGDAYGFVPPKERVEKLLKAWRSKDNPAGFTCDTVCFDSTITPEDVAVECEMYKAATTSDTTRRRIDTLHKLLYAGGPMVMQGALVGERHCRASGVYTTSSSNTMTCFLKVSAAARKAGIRKPSWLICGDDCVCIFETAGEEEDKRRLGLFATYMAQMGAPQGEVPRPYYHLELLDSCSSNVSVAHTPTGTFHYLTRDPRIPLARISIEGRGFNPLGSMLGYIIANYPALWVSRCITVKFLQELMCQDDISKITFDWYGNNYTMPVTKIPYIIEALHGKQVWNIKQYTSREVARVGQALKDNTIRPLRYYKRTARSVYAACRQRGGTLAFLARTLLSWVHNDQPKLDPKKVEQVRGFNPFEPYGIDFFGEEARPAPPGIFILLFLGIVALTGITFSLI